MQVRSKPVLIGVIVALSLWPAGFAAASDKKARGSGPGEEVTAVTLKAQPEQVAIGDSVTLSGTIDPPAEAEEVTIFDAEGKEVATVLTDPDGHFETSFAPAKNRILHAEWQLVSSEEVKVRVKPEVHVRLEDVSVFGRAKVSGWVRPAAPGGRVHLSFRRHGNVVAKKTVKLNEGRRFRTKFRVPNTGTFRSKAVLSHAALAPAAEWTGTRTTEEFRSLSQGSSGSLVKSLEKRLIQLGYYLPSANESFDEKTSDALLVFHKVQRMSRVGSVSSGTWNKLVSPNRPKARHGGKGRHFEIDQTRQVVFVVQNGKVKWILHTSTGANGATHDGTFTVFRKLAGYSPGRLYYPSYWDGGRAFHGWPEVPTYPASHGCARIPMWSATWMYSLTEIGDTVYVYH